MALIAWDNFSGSSSKIQLTVAYFMEILSAHLARSPMLAHWGRHIIKISVCFPFPFASSASLLSYSHLSPHGGKVAATTLSIIISPKNIKYQTRMLIEALFIFLKLEAIKMSFNRKIYKQSMVHLYSEILFNFLSKLSSQEKTWRNLNAYC